MKNWLITIPFVILLVLALPCCDSFATQIISLQDNEAQSQGIMVEPIVTIRVYKTEEANEYLEFLTNFDETRYEILGITTCMYTGPYTSDDFYMVTYKILSEPREAKSTGKVSLFKTVSEDDYCNFLANFDETRYEILNTTTSMHTGLYTNSSFYMVTFRELT